MLKSASLWSGIIAGGISQMKDTKAMSDGLLSKKRYAVHTSKNVVGSVGIAAGIEYGALVGTSILPGVGTIIGSIVGGMVGDGLGSYLGMQTGELLFGMNERTQENTIVF
ncbi:hypothetical protein [Ectobacillus polymachus]|uniref:hypothetical protein n=1 Tax=Ectobacillus polymachus TaxID=1508806 RepID=UPI003A84DCB0